MNMWRCDCGHCCKQSEFLNAANTFDTKDHVYGCPRCRARNPNWVEVCDAQRCSNQATCSTPTATGYRRTCSKHAPR